jgi:hypothetical protein
VAYRHTQSGWPVRIAFGLTALGFLVMASAQSGAGPTPRGALIAGAAVAAVLALVWSRLTVRIDDDLLRWSYGPGWPRFSLPLADIAAVEVTRTTFWQGWGIHRTRRGWLYNIAGRDAVLIHRTDKKQVLLGSDEPRRLKAAVERAIERRPEGIRR